MDQVHLGFPYHDTDAQLCIRSGPSWGTNVYVELTDDGQILCGIEECTIHLRFDNYLINSGYGPCEVPL